nr:MAG TPA: hypothetical protein [Caudoviricetes sp.]
MIKKLRGCLRAHTAINQRSIKTRLHIRYCICVVITIFSSNSFIHTFRNLIKSLL